MKNIMDRSDDQHKVDNSVNDVQSSQYQEDDLEAVKSARGKMRKTGLVYTRFDLG